MYIQFAFQLYLLFKKQTQAQTATTKLIFFVPFNL
jgi:hypothetical protein